MPIDSSVTNGGAASLVPSPSGGVAGAAAGGSAGAGTNGGAEGGEERLADAERPAGAADDELDERARFAASGGGCDPAAGGRASAGGPVTS